MASPRSSTPPGKERDIALLNAYLAEVIEESRALRDVLVRNERAAAKLQRVIEKSGSVLDGMEALEGSMRGPRELPETIEHFEATRRKARHALFALASKEEVSLSEMARRFGFSRQLASRIVQEATSGGSKARRRRGAR